MHVPRNRLIQYYISALLSLPIVVIRINIVLTQNHINSYYNQGKNEGFEKTITSLLNNDTVINNISGTNISIALWADSSENSASDSFDFNSGFIPIYKTLDGTPAILNTISFSTVKNAKNNGYDDAASANITYSIKLENGMLLKSGNNEVVTISLFNYKIGNNKNLYITSSASVYGWVSNREYSHFSADASISTIKLTYIPITY